MAVRGERTLRRSIIREHKVEVGKSVQHAVVSSEGDGQRLRRNKTKQNQTNRKPSKMMTRGEMVSEAMCSRQREKKER